MTASHTVNGQTLLPRELADLVDEELGKGEHVLWAVQPIGRLYVRPSLLTLYIGIPWTAIVICWMLLKSGEGFVVLGGLPFLIGGVWMMTMPLWILRRARRRVYAVTEQRAIVIDGGPEQRVRSYGPERFNNMHVREGADGSGDIIFEGVISGLGRVVSKTGFLAIPPVRRVEALLRQVAEAHAEQSRTELFS